jgi:phospholipid/cholesterol/gamma-HCH transport system permease protein
LGVLEDTGEFLYGLAETAGRGVILFGKAVVQLRHFPGNADKFVHQILLCGVAAIPVVAITGMFSGMVIAAQTGDTLRQFGLADLTLGPIVGGSLLRELGPVLAAICVAGFVGGSMASVIATMRVNEEIDALETMSINPVRYLVMPRLAAMAAVLPLLSMFASFLGIMGGAVVARFQVGVPFKVFFDQLKWAMAVRDVLFGAIKALVFGIIITSVSCEQGFYASGGAEGVGRATMRAVVYSFLLILVANYLLFSLIYMTVFTKVLD